MEEQIKYKSQRGGSYYNFPWPYRSSYRIRSNSKDADSLLGFRIVIIVHLFVRTTMPEFQIEMVNIPAGEYVMGSPDNEPGRFSDEEQHLVKLEGFRMSKNLITQKEWRFVASLPQIDIPLKPSPSYFTGDDLPVESVNWYEAIEFCKRLSIYLNEEVTLPSEAQWEYACRAGTTTAYYTGETLDLTEANFWAEGSPKKTTPVGTYPPNAWGLHDMHGNLWEWCLDDWHDTYEGAPTDGSAWIDPE